MSRRKRIYLTNEELAEALVESQKTGEPTVKVCECFRKIAQHLLGNPKYRNYSKELHEDMVSAALIKCIKNIHNFKPEYADRSFNYYTRCCETSFWATLAQHYKQMNIQRDLTRDYVIKLEQCNPTAAKTILDSLLPNNTTNKIKGE